MMTKKLSKHGNSLALVIDKPILDLFGIDENTTLRVRPNGRGFFIEPVDSNEGPDDLDAVMQQIEDRYEKVFQKLAE